VTICEAIAKRRLLRFSYGGHEREVVPAAYGPHKTTGNFVLRAYQVGGTSSSRVPPFWSLFEEAEMSDLTMSDQTFPENPDRYDPDDAHIDVVCCLDAN